MTAAGAGSAPSAARVAALVGPLVALTVIGSSAVAVALPVLSIDLSLDRSGAAWVLALFAISFSVSTALFGRIADLAGLRLPLRLGAVLLACGSVLAASAWSFPSIVVGRLLQGAGAGAVPVLSVAILTARFPGEARARALGSLTAVVTIVSASGPLIGGLLTELVSWRAVLALPVAALALAEPVTRLAPADRGSGGRVDASGALLVAGSVTGLALVLQAPAIRGGPIVIAPLVAAAATGFALLARHVRRRPNGFLPLEIVANARLMVASLVGLSGLAAYIAALFAIPAILSQDYGWTPVQVGLGMLPGGVAGAIASRAAGGLTAWIPHDRLAAVLAGVSAAGLLLVALGAVAPAVMLAGFGLVVVGFGGAQVVLVDAVPDFVPTHLRGTALGTFNLVYFTGSAVGASTAGGLAGVVGLPGAIAVVALLPLAGAAATRRLRRAR